MRDRRQGKPVLALSQLLLDLVSNKTLLKRKNTIQSRAFNSNRKTDENVESKLHFASETRREKFRKIFFGVNCSSGRIIEKKTI